MFDFYRTFLNWTIGFLPKLHLHICVYIVYKRRFITTIHDISIKYWLNPKSFPTPWVICLWCWSICREAESTQASGGWTTTLHQVRQRRKWKCLNMACATRNAPCKRNTICAMRHDPIEYGPCNMARLVLEQAEHAQCNEIWSEQVGHVPCNEARPMPILEESNTPHKTHEIPIDNGFSIVSVKKKDKTKKKIRVNMKVVIDNGSRCASLSHESDATVGLASLTKWFPIFFPGMYEASIISTNNYLSRKKSGDAKLIMHLC